MIHEAVSEHMHRGLPLGERAAMKGFVSLRSEDFPQLVAEIFNPAGEIGRSLAGFVLKKTDWELRRI
jgi:hypothetical protein